MNELDGGGIYGAYFHYGLTILMVGGAIIIFLYLWYKGRLDLDEDPKIQMLKAGDQDEYERK